MNEGSPSVRSSCTKGSPALVSWGNPDIAGAWKGAVSELVSRAGLQISLLEKELVASSSVRTW